MRTPYSVLKHMRSWAYNRHRRKRWAESVNTNTPFVLAQPDGVKIKLYPDSRFCEVFYLDGIEHGELQFFRNFLRRGDVVLDIGANIGIFTLTAASAVGNTGLVHAFEPAWNTSIRLRDNIDLNNFRNVFQHTIALGDKNEQRMLATHMGRYDAWNSLAMNPCSDTGFQPSEVQVVTLDHFCSSHSIHHVDLIKIDVEGWEEKVLLGGRDLLSSDDAPVLQVEFTDSAAKAAGTTCRRVYNLLRSFGYSMFRYDHSANWLREEELQDVYPYVNLVAVKDLEPLRNRLTYR